MLLEFDINKKDQPGISETIFAFTNECNQEDTRNAKYQHISVHKMDR